jgi:hypothetical protein
MTGRPITTRTSLLMHSTTAGARATVCGGWPAATGEDHRVATETGGSRSRLRAWWAHVRLPRRDGTGHFVDERGSELQRTAELVIATKEWSRS